MTIEMWTQRAITWKAKGVGLLSILLVVCFVPYLFPVTASVSRSYVAGFNNRLCVLLLIAGSLIFAMVTRGKIATEDSHDQRLSKRSLYMMGALTLAICLSRVIFAPASSLGGEMQYFENRQQLAIAGLVPYRGFEFAYGPLLLYPTIWISHLLHLSLVHSYGFVWCVSWALGTWMIWFVVRNIDFAVPYRNLAFVILLLVQVVWTDFGGLNYTPVRSYAACFLIVLTHRMWRATGNSWVLAGFSLLSAVLAFAISIEQFIAVACGLGLYMFMLTFVAKLKPLRVPLLLFALGLALVYRFADRLGLLISFRGFASGGYAYPLMPSFPIAVALASYVAAGCVLYKRLQAREFESLSMPLVLTGCALLPVALGRCDLLHISAAVPLFVVGSLSLWRMPKLRLAWGTVLLIGLVLVPLGLRRSKQFWHHFGFPIKADDVGKINTGEVFVTDQFYVSKVQLNWSELPCDRTYFSPSFMPLPDEPSRPMCLDTGYYQGLVDVITPTLIDEKINELKRRPFTPLILENSPLISQFPTELSDMASLKRTSASFWVPRARFKPVRYSVIGDYIEAHYTRGRIFAGGRMQIWEPVPNTGP